LSELIRRITDHVKAFPDKVALEFVDPPLQRFTYRGLDEGVRRVMAYLLSLDLERGDRMALQLDKGVEFVLLNLAALRLGIVTLPLNPAYPEAELRYFLADSGARLFFGDETRREDLGGLPADLPELEQVIFLNPRDPEGLNGLLGPTQEAGSPLPELELGSDDTAVMIYTSGTTGRPKGAQITYGNLDANTHALYSAWGWRSDDVLLHVLPLFHVHGLFVAWYGALYAGATALLTRSFDPRRTLEFLVERRCTVFMAVPTIHRRLLAVPEAVRFDLGHMRLITSGSDRLPDRVFLGFQETFGYTLLERYGMTETGMNLSNPLHGERRLGSVGLPLPGVQARVVNPATDQPLPDGDVGEVQIRGANVFKGYWRDPVKTAEAFTPDGWLRTGDLGLREPDGYFALQGRSKDLIITGGLNVYPPEVERVLAEHPAVATSAVIGLPDPEWGERVVAVIEAAAGARVVPEELIAFCRERLAPYKCPRAVHRTETLPRNAMGKIQKAELRKHLSEFEKPS
jgi:malonyl-CoA/methylmalonyl-CoA synthetase